MSSEPCTLHDVLTEAHAHAARAEFLAAHELYEALWRRHGDTPTGRWLRAMAQWMAAYHQATLGRAHAAARTWQRARAKLTQLDALPPPLAERVEAWLRDHGMTTEGPRMQEFVSRGAAPLAEPLRCPCVGAPSYP